MLNRHIRTLFTLTFAFSLLAGRVTDLTTGQPLAGVTVTVAGPSHGVAKTDKSGHYQIPGLKAGSYTLNMASNDVPPQNTTVRIGANQTRILDIKLCSTTLDYHCGPATGGGGGG